MSKTIYSLRPADAAVIACTDSGWKQVGSVLGFVQPRLGNDMVATWFKFDGVLHCAFLATAKTIVAKLVNGNLEPVSELETDQNKAAWGEAVNYGGALRWLERLDDETTYLYSFDGALHCAPVTGVPGIYFRSFGSFLPGMEALQLTVDGQKLVVLPSGAAIDPSSRCFAIARVHTLELKWEGTEVKAEARYIDDVFEGYPLNVETGLDFNISSYIHNGDTYSISAEGRLIGPKLRKDLLVQTIDHLPAIGGSDVQVNFSAKVMPRLNGNLLGSRLIHEDGDYHTISGVNDATSLWLTPGPSIAKGDELAYAPGFLLGSSPDCTPGLVSRVHWLATSKGFIVLILGRSRNPGSGVPSPSCLVEFDGKSARMKPLPLVSVFGSCATYDASTHSVTLVYHDGLDSTVKLVKYNLSSGAISKSVPLWPQPVATSGQGIAPGTFVAYEDGEPDARITGVAYDADTGSVTVSVTSVNAALELEYCKDTLWLKADRIDKIDGGFVHHIKREEPGYIGPIQYRVKVTRA